MSTSSFGTWRYWWFCDMIFCLNYKVGWTSQWTWMARNSLALHSWFPTTTHGFFSLLCGQALAMFRKDGDKKTGPQRGDREDWKSEATIGVFHPWKLVRTSISENAGGQYFRWLQNQAGVVQGFWMEFLHEVCFVKETLFTKPLV